MCVDKYQFFFQFFIFLLRQSSSRIKISRFFCVRVNKKSNKQKVPMQKKTQKKNLSKNEIAASLIVATSIQESVSTICIFYKSWKSMLAAHSTVRALFVDFDGPLY